MTTSLPTPISPPASSADPRPFWSVMIPRYQPDENYLRQTCASVLQQDPGPDQMQTEVVDDRRGFDVRKLRSLSCSA